MIDIDKSVLSRRISNAVEWGSATALILAAAIVLVGIFKLTRLDWHFVFLLLAAIAGVALLAGKTISTMVNLSNEHRDLDSELHDRLAKIERG
jgi:hypothetical protein